MMTNWEAKSSVIECAYSYSPIITIILEQETLLTFFILFIYLFLSIAGFASLIGSVVKNLPANAGDVGSIPRSGRAPGEGNGNPFHYCLGNPMDKECGGL